MYKTHHQILGGKIKILEELGQEYNKKYVEEVKWVVIHALFCKTFIFCPMWLPSYRHSEAWCISDMFFLADMWSSEAKIPGFVWTEPHVTSQVSSVTSSVVSSFSGEYSFMYGIGQA